MCLTHSSISAMKGIATICNSHTLAPQTPCAESAQ